MAVELKLILLPQPVQSKNKLSLAISVTKRRLVCVTDQSRPAFFGFGSIDAAVSELNTITRYHRQLNIIAG